MHKRLLLNGLKYLLGFALLAYVVWRSWSAPPGSQGFGLKDALARPIQLVPLAMATIIYSVAIVFTFLRWYTLVRAQELPFSLSSAFRLGLVGLFWNTFLPGSVGGDLVKAAFLIREQDRRTVAVATVLIDRALALWGILFLVPFLGGLFWICGEPVVCDDAYLQTLILSSGVIFAVSIVLWAVLGFLPAWRAERFANRLEKIRRVGPSAAEFWRAVWMYRAKGVSVAIAFMLSLCTQFCLVLAIYFTAQIFQNPAELAIPSLALHFLLVPIGIAVQALFPSPGGVGGGEFIFGWLYARVDPSMEPAGVLASLGKLIIGWGLGLVGYFVYLRMRPCLRSEAELASDDVMTQRPLAKASHQRDWPMSFPGVPDGKEVEPDHKRD